MTLLAHKDADGGVQTLRDHLHNAGDLAESYESEFSQIPRMAALLHDVGKVAQQFQTYLISGKGRRGEIPHARQGAFVVNDLPISNSAAEIVKEILELVIINIMESFLIASMKSVMRLFSQVLRKQINRILNMRMGKSNRGYMIWISTCKTPSSRPKKMFSILQDELNC